MSDFASRVAGEVATKQEEQSRFAAQVAGEVASHKTSGLADLDEVISLRLAGGTYKQIAEITGWSVARVRRACEAEGR